MQTGLAFGSLKSPTLDGGVKTNPFLVWEYMHRRAEVGSPCRALAAMSTLCGCRFHGGRESDVDPRGMCVCQALEIFLLEFQTALSHLLTF